MIKSACFSDFLLTTRRAVIIIPDSDRQSGSFSFPTEAVVGGIQRRIGNRRTKAEAVKAEAISLLTKRRLSKPKRKLGAGEG